MLAWLNASIVNKLWLVTSLTALSLLSAVFGMIWYFTSSQVTQGSLDRIEAIAATLGDQIDADAMIQLMEDFPEKDSITRSNGISERFSALTKPLTRAYSSNQLSTTIYTMSLIPSERAQVEQAPDRVHKDVMEFILMSGDQPFYRHRDDYRPEMAAALFAGESVRVQPYTSQNGRWVSALEPLRSTDGNIIGFLEVDLQLDTLLAQTRSRLWLWSIPLLLLASQPGDRCWLARQPAYRGSSARPGKTSQTFCGR
jgi:hypothetical protein